MEAKKSNKKTFYKKLHNKYRLVIMQDETFEEKLSFRLSRLNVFVAVGTLVILLIVGTTFLIAFTSLKEYIPGYADVNIKKQVVDLQIRTDSLEHNLNQKEKYINNIKEILMGKDGTDTIMPEPKKLDINYDTITINKSREDSLLREEIEKKSQYNLFFTNNEARKGLLKAVVFFPPVKGIVTNKFNIKGKHLGVDVVAPKNELIKSIADGTVILSSWTLETGYILAIQHSNNTISVYKHNSALLKQQGEIVKAGEPIAIIGETGEFTSGTHLHFELWYNGNPINPEDYLIF